MVNIDVAALKMRIETVLPMLNEYQRRRYLSAEAKAIGRGGSVLSSVSQVCQSNTDVWRERTLVITNKGLYGINKISNV